MRDDGATPSISIRVGEGLAVATAATILLALGLATAVSCSSSSGSQDQIPPRSVNAGSACLDAGASCNLHEGYHVAGDPCSGQEVDALQCGDPAYFCCATHPVLLCGDRYCSKGNTCDGNVDTYCAGITSQSSCGSFACVGSCSCTSRGGCDCPACQDRTSTLGSKCDAGERYVECVPSGVFPNADAGSCRVLPVDNGRAGFCCSSG